MLWFVGVWGGADRRQFRFCVGPFISRLFICGGVGVVYGGGGPGQCECEKQEAGGGFLRVGFVFVVAS